MAGSDHTGRRPTRLSSITRRDQRAIGDRRRVAEADIRSAIYVRPLGKGYDVVKNVCNDQEYVVANATGSTHTAGQVVPLGSFTGNPGEFTFGKPPAGYGGASAYSIQKTSAGYGYGTGLPLTGAESETWFESDIWCYDAIRDYGVSAGFYTRTYATGTTPRWFVGLQQFTRADFPVPTASEGSGERVGEKEVLLPPSGGAALLVVAGPPGSTRAVLYHVDETDGVVNSSRRYRWASFDSAGTLLAEDDYIGPTFWIENFDWCLSGGSAYCIEPREADESYTGPPYSSGVRITKRNLSTLAVEASYDFPSVTPYNGSASRGQWPIGINPRDGGGVWVHFYNYSSAFVTTYWRRPLSSTLTVAAADNSVSWGAAGYGISKGHCIRRVVSKYFVVGTTDGGADNDIFEHSGTAWVADRQIDIVPTPDGWLERTATEALVLRDSSYLFRIY